MKDSDAEQIGDIPEHQETLKLKFLYSIQSGENLTILDITDGCDNVNIYPVYGANGFRGYYKKFLNDGKYCLIGRQGALSGNIHIVNGKFWATDHAIVVYENNGTNVQYLYYLLIAMNLNQYALDIAAQPGLSVSKIMNLFVIKPKYKEQQKITDYLDKKCARIAENISKRQALIGKLT